MRKINKVKIIEVGRTFSSEELNQIRGGECDPHTTCAELYTSCGEMGLVSCQSSNLSGYESDGSGTFCGSGQEYSQCVEGSPYSSCDSGRVYNTCDSGEVYSS